MLRVKNAQHYPIIADEEHFFSESSVIQLVNGELLVTSPDNRGLAHTDAGSIVLSRSSDGRPELAEYTTTVCFQCREKRWLFQRADHRIIGWGITVPCRSYPLPGAGGWDCPHCSARCKRAGNRIHHAIYRSRQELGAALACAYRPNARVLCQGWHPGIAGWRPAHATQRRPAQRSHISFPPNDDDAFRSYLVRSDDHGETWYYYSTIAMDPAGILNLWEPTITRLLSGRLVASIAQRLRPHDCPTRWVFVYLLFG